MVVATAGPTARAVVLEQFDERGFVFWTSSESPKGRALAADPGVALVWLWDGRQVRVEGRVEPVSAEEDERHWQQRDGKRPLAAFRQSEPVESREELLERLAAVPDAPERPPFWRGYRVLPERSEEHTSELQSPVHLVCRLLLEKKKNNTYESRMPD